VPDQMFDRWAAQGDCGEPGLRRPQRIPIQVHRKSPWLSPGTPPRGDHLVEKRETVRGARAPLVSKHALAALRRSAAGAVDPSQYVAVDDCDSFVLSARARAATRPATLAPITSAWFLPGVMHVQTHPC